MKLDKYFAIALVYFFINGLGLPQGLLYTTLLTPFFYFWIRANGGRQLILKFLLFSVPFAVIHFLNGVVALYYLKSAALLFCIFIFTYGVHFFLKKDQGIERIFSRLALINFGLTLVAVAAFFSPLREHFWTERHLSVDVGIFPRLEMFTYEPSYYSTLLVPIILYFLTKLFFRSPQTEAALGWLVLLLVPLALSQSLGVILTLMMTLVAFFLLNFRHLIQRKTVFYALSSGGVSLVALLVLLVIFYPDNPIFLRIASFLKGTDSSGLGRTSDAVTLSYLIADEKSLWFGSGLGQIKVLGETVIRNYYHYAGDDIRITRIPSAIGETLGTFGVFGVILRLGVEIYLYFKTRVRNNYFRTLVFFYIFFYQFTGSFLTNVAEYVLWAIAFTPCCFYFDRKVLAASREQPAAIEPLPA